MSSSAKRSPVSLWHCLLAVPFISFFQVAVGTAQSPDAVVAAVQPFVDRHELAGAVMLVADRDHVLMEKAVGHANIESGRQMQADCIFWIASQSKPITAAALMMLVDEGRVSVHDPVEQYLPEFRGQMVIAEKDNDHVLLKRPSHPITVRELLSHMSGLPFKSAVEEPTLDRDSLATRVRSYAMTPLLTEPGTNYQYSNAGINTAARIIEVVTGQTFEDYLNERLFEPLGMKDTSFWPNEEQLARIAEAYRPGENNSGLQHTTISQLSYPLDDRNQRFPMPAGGLFSTARDVSQFYRMLLSGGELNGKRYLSEDAVRQLTMRQTPAHVQQKYGFGFSINGDTFGHGGAYSTNSTADRASGLILIWLVQHAGFPGDGAKAQDTFRQTATREFGQAKQ
ncbi:MAG: beta-lactamase family protein [Planctomycetaceae bacterium]|nr:beta-lactamase family protein [Planctomycetaceae bacterium]